MFDPKVKPAEAYWEELHVLPIEVRCGIKNLLLGAMSAVRAKADLISAYPDDSLAVHDRALSVLKQAQQWEAEVRLMFGFDPNVKEVVSQSEESKMYLKEELDLPEPSHFIARQKSKGILKEDMDG